jgi:hypothetical protein
MLSDLNRTLKKTITMKKMYYQLKERTKTMKRFILLSALAFFLAMGSAYAQYGFGTNNPDQSAVVDIYSASKGMLIPRVALTSVTSASPVTSPANSLLVFNTATAGTPPNDVTPGYYYWSTASSKWFRLSTQGSTLFSEILSGTNTTASMLVGTGASLAPTGSGTVTANIFITGASTTDAVDLQTSEVAGNLPIGNIAPGTANKFLVTNSLGATEWKTFNLSATFTGDGVTTALGIANDAVTAAMINADVAGSGLVPNGTTGALDINTDLTLKITGDALGIDLSNPNSWTGLQTFNTVLPQSTVTPSDSKDLTTKAYVDGLGTSLKGEPYLVWQSSANLTNEKVAVGGDGLTFTASTATFDVNVDNSTIEINSDILRVKASGITANEIATGAVGTDEIANGAIIDEDVNASAAIAGTKISPDFGSQAVTTSGNISTTGTGTLSIGGTSVLGGDTKVGTVTFAHASVNPDLGVQGNLEVFGTIYGNINGSMSGVLSEGNGIADFSYDGSASAQVAVNKDATLAFTAGVLGIDLSHANTWTGDQTFTKATVTSTFTLSGLSGAADVTVLTINGSGVVHTQAISNLSSFGNIVTKTGNYTATSTDGTIVVDASGGNVTVTLPAASSTTLGLKLSIKKIDTSGNNVIIDGDGSETIDGQTTMTWNVPWQGYVVQCDGTGWYVVGKI